MLCGAAGKKVADLHQPDVRLPFRLRGEDFQRLRLEVRGNDRLDEQARSGQQPGRGGVDGAVQAEDRAERADRVAGHGAVEGFGRAFRHGRAAGIVVFDDHGRRLGELADDGQGAVQVQEVVVGKLFAVELLGRNDRGAARPGIAVQSRLLVRILAIAEHDLASQAKMQRRRERAFAPLVGKIVGDHAIVGSRVGERLAGKLPPQLGRRAAVGRDLVEHRRILPRVRGDRDKSVVLRRCANQRRTANVDLLHRLGERHARPGHRRRKRIQVHHDQLEGEDAVLGQGFHVLGIVAPAEDAAVNLRMQGLQTAVHHLWKAGVLGDVADGNALGFQVFAGAAGAVDFNPCGSQTAGEVAQTEFVADADQGALNARRLHGGSFPFFSPWRRQNNQRQDTPP